MLASSRRDRINRAWNHSFVAPPLHPLYLGKENETLEEFPHSLQSQKYLGGPYLRSVMALGIYIYRHSLTDYNPTNLSTEPTFLGPGSLANS
jgi:hypothetical protein